MCNECPYRKGTSYDNYETLYTNKSWYDGINSVHICHKTEGKNETPCLGSIRFGKVLKGFTDNEIKDQTELEVPISKKETNEIQIDKAI